MCLVCQVEVLNQEIQKLKFEMWLDIIKDLDVQNEIKMSILFIGFWNLDIGVCKEGHKKCITKLDDIDKTKYNISFVFEKEKI